MKRATWAWVAILTAAGAAPTHAKASAQPCDPEPVQSIPHRAPDALTGSEFARRVQALSGVARDALIRAQLLAGNMPQFLRHLVPITLESPATSSEGAHRITVCVLPDYLAVGTNKDFMYVPMGLEAALDIARRFGFDLPTPKLVDAIYEDAVVKLKPQPLPAGDQMRSTAYVVHHNELIQEQRSALDAPLGELTAGHKKDLVLTNRLWEFPGRVAIYGWHKADHEPIQPLSTFHGARYSDYSHGVRLVSNMVTVDGVRRSLTDVLAQPDLAKLLTREGPLRSLSQRLAELAGSLSAQDAWPLTARQSRR